MPAPVHVDLVRLRNLIEVEALSVNAAARELGVSHATVLRRIREAGIERQSGRTIYGDREWLLAREREGRSLAETARLAGVGVSAIATARRRTRLVKPTAPKRRIDMAEVERRLAAGQRPAEISRALGVSSGAVADKLRLAAARRVTKN